MIEACKGRPEDEIALAMEVSESVADTWMFAELPPHDKASVPLKPRAAVVEAAPFEIVCCDAATEETATVH
jgi:hypothetical protein